MHIDRIDLYRVAMPLISPWRTAYGEDAVIESGLVRMTSGDQVGWGEASPLAAPTYSPEWAGGVFQTARDWRAWNTCRAGTVAGAPGSGGYRYVNLTFDGKPRRMLAHRVVWALATGAWPEVEIDHRNGIRDDNRLSNLREATRSQNKHNVGLSRRNTSGLRGVSWFRAGGRWRADIMAS